ncbi:MAG: mannose-1-phosphate guanylyltransferase/mannose-6-phosphate isomerase [Hyphomicrobiaceae bacterium]
MPHIQPVILSGGAGTRLWPLSRSLYPKQFIRFYSGDEASLLGATLQRLPSSDDYAPPIILCNNDHRFLVRAELEQAGIEAKAIVLEPVARNTAAPIAVAALMALADDPEAVIVVMPSDHKIDNSAEFLSAVERATRVAETGRLVLFGITPSEAHTGYGYIRRGGALGHFEGVFDVDAFFEKPEMSVAAEYVDAGDYLWNSGIFVLNAQTLVDEMAQLAPDTLKAARDALDGANSDLEFLRLDSSAFSTAPKISIDYAVMEKTKAAALLAPRFDWSDVGSWDALWNNAQHDAEGNFVRGEAFMQESSGCYVHSERALVAGVGLRDLVIVETPDALLVADKARSQDVGKIVQDLRSSGRVEQEQHLRNHRPWGYFETLSIAPRFQVKKLHVKPGAKLSMQMHHHRSEHWIVVKGTARATIGDREQLVRESESIYITATQWHRLENPGLVPLEIIEIQIGTYLGEDDIVRSEDVYNRGPDETK